LSAPLDLSIVIPCYNEEDGVARLKGDLWPVVQSLSRDRTVELVFVDDGSRDNTWDRLHDSFGNAATPRISIRFERHTVNRGLGAAIRTGLAASTGAVVVTTDSDATYGFGEIPALLARLAPGIDIVTASPYHPDGGVDNVPAYRLILSRGSSFLYRALVDWRVHTYTALFRCYRREVIDSVSFASDGFLAGTELLVKAMRRGYRVAEHPTVLHSRVAGVSKAKVARTISAHLRFQGRVALDRLHISPLDSDKPARVGHSGESEAV
jgi:dolichol-phosphate mannosyltransferase